MPRASTPSRAASTASTSGGIDGQRLKDKWTGGPKTYLGVEVEGFPNMLMLMGPHTALGNIPRSIEYNVEWVTGLVKYMRDHSLTRVDARPEGVKAWTDHVIALGESLKIVNAIGIGEIEKHAVELTDYLMDELESVGAFLVTHRDLEHRSGMVVFRFYDRLEEENELLRRLHVNGVYVAMRFTSNIGGIRVSCHYFNNQADVDHLIAELRKAREEKPPDFCPPELS